MEVSWPLETSGGQDRNERVSSKEAEAWGLSEGPWPHSLSLAGPLAPFPLWGIASMAL